MTDGTMIDVEALSGVLDADPRLGPGQGRRRHRARRPQRGAGPARAGDGEPRRHRPPDDRRGDLDRHPRHRRPAAQHLRPGRGDRAGPRRRQRARARAPPTTRSCCGRRGSGVGALGAISRRDPALRPRLHARSGSTRRGRARRSSTASRSAPTPTTTSSSSPSPTPTPPWCSSATAPRRRRARAAASPPTSTTSCSRTGRWRRSRRPARRCRAAIPALSRLAGRLASGSRTVDRSDRVFANERRVRFTEMEYGGAARARARGGAAGDRVGARATATRSSSRSRCGSPPATTPCSAPRTSATPPTSPSTSTGGWSGGPTSRRSRRSWTPTAAAPTGASATSRRPRRWRRATRRWAEFQARPRRARPRPRLHQRVRRARPRP